MLEQSGKGTGASRWLSLDRRALDSNYSRLGASDALERRQALCLVRDPLAQGG